MDAPVLIIWNEKYVVGNETLDEHHQRMLNIINDLYSRLQIGISSSELSQILQDLIENAEIHFRAEEAVMQECGYPDLSEQENAHQRYIIELRRLIIGINEDWSDSTNDLFVFLKGWWQGHIVKMDKKYSPFLGKLKDQDKIHSGDNG